MKTSKEILSELLEIAPALANATVARVPYAVPAGFFDGFLTVLMQRIQKENMVRYGTPETRELSTTQELSTAQDLSTAQELGQVAPFLASIPKNSTYQVPTGYFESVRIPISEIQHAPVVSMITRTPHSENTRETGQLNVRKLVFPIRLVRYLTAACIVAMLGLSVFHVVNRPVADPLKALTQVSDQDMANYLEDSDVHESDASAMAAKGTVSMEFTDSEIHELFSSVSDNELEQYLPLPTDKRNVN